MTWMVFTRDFWNGFGGYYAEKYEGTQGVKDALKRTMGIIDEGAKGIDECTFDQIKDPIKEWSRGVAASLDDGDDSHLSMSERLWAGVQGVGDIGDSLLSTKGIIVGSASAAAIIGTGGLAATVLPEAAATTAGSVVNGTIAAYGTYKAGEGVYQIATADTKEEAQEGGTNLGVGAILLAGSGKKAIKDTKAAVKGLTKAKASTTASAGATGAGKESAMVKAKAKVAELTGEGAQSHPQHVIAEAEKLGIKLKAPENAFSMEGPELADAYRADFAKQLAQRIEAETVAAGKGATTSAEASTSARATAAGKGSAEATARAEASAGASAKAGATGAGKGSAMAKAKAKVAELTGEGAQSHPQHVIAEAEKLGIKLKAPKNAFSMEGPELADAYRADFAKQLAQRIEAEAASTRAAAAGKESAMAKAKAKVAELTGEGAQSHPQHVIAEAEKLGIKLKAPENAFSMEGPELADAYRADFAKQLAQRIEAETVAAGKGAATSAETSTRAAAAGKGSAEVTSARAAAAGKGSAEAASARTVAAGKESAMAKAKAKVAELTGEGAQSHPQHVIAEAEKLGIKLKAPENAFSMEGPELADAYRADFAKQLAQRIEAETVAATKAATKAAITKAAVAPAVAIATEIVEKDTPSTAEVKNQNTEPNTGAADEVTENKSEPVVENKAAEEKEVTADKTQETETVVGNKAAEETEAASVLPAVAAAAVTEETEEQKVTTDKTQEPETVVENETAGETSETVQQPSVTDRPKKFGDLTRHETSSASDSESVSETPAVRRTLNPSGTERPSQVRRTEDVRTTEDVAPNQIQVQNRANNPINTNFQSMFINFINLMMKFMELMFSIFQRGFINA